MNDKFIIILMDSTQQIQIVADFKQTCINDIEIKEKHLEELKGQNIKRLQIQASSLIDSLSKAFIDLQDALVRNFRNTAKIVFEHESNIISQDYKKMVQILSNKIDHIYTEIHQQKKILWGNGNKTKKLLARFAQGKFHQQHAFYEKQLLDLGFQKRNYTYDQQELEQQTNQIIQLLVAIPQKPIQEPNFTESRLTKSILSLKNMSKQNPSKMSYFSQHSYMLNNKSSMSMLSSKFLNNKRQQIQQMSEAESKSMKEEPETSAIEDFKEMKSIRKRNKLQGQIKKIQKTQASTVNNLARLVLQRQKLLKQIEE